MNMRYSIATNYRVDVMVSGNNYWWEECLMHQDWVEPAKCILGGTECRIDVKHKDSVLLQQTPVIISTKL